MKDKGYAVVREIVNAKSKTGKSYIYAILESGGDFDVAYPCKDSTLSVGALCQYWTDRRDPGRPCKRCRGLG